MIDKISEENFLRLCKKLEILNDNFSIKGIPEEYKDIWAPNNEVRLWQIPRMSAEFLKFLVLAREPKTILELGTSAGYSAIWLASAAKTYGGKVFTIELARPKIKMAELTFKKAGLTKNIDLIEGKISEVLLRWDKKLDFVFLDADKKNYLQYLKLMEPHLNNNALLIADNALDFANLMQDYLQYVSSSPRYYSFLLKADNGLMCSIKLS